MQCCSFMCYISFLFCTENESLKDWWMKRQNSLLLDIWFLICRQCSVRWIIKNLRCIQFSNGGGPDDFSAPPWTVYGLSALYLGSWTTVTQVLPISLSYRTATNQIRTWKMYSYQPILILLQPDPLHHTPEQGPKKYGYPPQATVIKRTKTMPKWMSENHFTFK